MNNSRIDRYDKFKVIIPLTQVLNIGQLSPENDTDDLTDDHVYYNIIGVKLESFEGRD